MNWYLLAYDIRDPRRLQRVHRYLSRRGQAVQESVFLVRRAPGEVKALLDGVGALIDPQEDDIRLYPIPHPGQLWLQCHRPLVLAEAPPSAQGGRLLATLKRWWAGRHE